MTKEYKLTDHEALLLDGKVSQNVQELVDSAKNRIAMFEAMPELGAEKAGFIADVVGLAKKAGKLAFYHNRIRYCPVCKTNAGYHVHARSSRKQFGHKKGDIDYGSPRSMPGVELQDSFVTIEGLVYQGCCTACFDSLKPKLAERLADVTAEIPEAITGIPPKWRKWTTNKCSACGWVGPEGKMLRMRTMMGDGYYHGGCPSCKAKNVMFSSVIKAVETRSFEVLPASEEEMSVTW